MPIRTRWSPRFLYAQIWTVCSLPVEIRYRKYHRKGAP